MADLVIRGMEMPKNCDECFCLSEWDDCRINHEWKFADEFDKTKDRLPSCPLVPLPEGHGRLGDLDVLQEEFKKSHDGKRLMLIDTAPTIVPAEGGTDECFEN